jgi:hypothetical protein
MKVLDESLQIYLIAGHPVGMETAAPATRTRRICRHPLPLNPRAPQTDPRGPPTHPPWEIAP